MNQLSPAAQVMIAVTHVYQDHGGDPPARAITAAALRAAADQVVPQCDQPLYADDFAHGAWFARDDVRDDLLRIVAELEAQ